MGYRTTHAMGEFTNIFKNCIYLLFHKLIIIVLFNICKHFSHLIQSRNSIKRSFLTILFKNKNINILFIIY